MSAQRVGDRRRRQVSDQTGLAILRLWRFSNMEWEGLINHFGGHAHVEINPRTGTWRYSRGGCFAGDTAEDGCRPFGQRYWIWTLDPRNIYSAEQRRADFDLLARTIRELSNAWVRSEVPSDEIGRTMTSDAVVSLSRLAVAAHVPLETEHAQRSDRTAAAAVEIIFDT